MPMERPRLPAVSYTHLNEAVRQQLCEKHLGADAEIMDGNVFAAVVKVFDGSAHHFLCRKHDVEIRYRIASLLDCMVEKFRLNPAGAHGHAADFARLELNVQRAGIAEHECFGRAINIDVGNGLEGGEGIKLQDLCAFMHLSLIHI